jgi:hypothetical protein
LKEARKDEGVRNWKGIYSISLRKDKCGYAAVANMLGKRYRNVLIIWQKLCTRAGGGGERRRINKYIKRKTKYCGMRQ